MKEEQERIVVSSLLNPPNSFKEQSIIMNEFKRMKPIISLEQEQQIFQIFNTTNLSRNLDSIGFLIWFYREYCSNSTYRDQSFHGYVIKEIILESIFSNVLVYQCEKNCLKIIECKDAYDFESTRTVVRYELSLIKLLYLKYSNRVVKVVDLISDSMTKRYILVLNNKYSFSLQTLIKGNVEMSFNRRKSIAIQCFDCLQCVHDESLHLNVKPDTFLIVEQDKVVIADLGLSGIQERPLMKGD